jgi:hypothetical protein
MDTLLTKAPLGIMESQDYFASILRQRLATKNLTVYQLALKISETTGIPVKTVHARISRYLRKDPTSLVLYSQIVEALGGKILII